MNPIYDILKKGEKELDEQLFIEKDKAQKFEGEGKLYNVNYYYKLLLVVLISMILFEGNRYINSKPGRPIKVAFYIETMIPGGVSRVIALLLNLLYKEKKFNFYLITENGKSDDEYSLPNDITRICLRANKINLFQAIQRENIDIFIYNSYYRKLITQLNKLKKTKIICYNHSSIFFWIYKGRYDFQDSIYQTYKNSKYIISLIPLENDYLFKIWGINSFFMDNPLTFDYDSVKPSDLSQKNIIMIGRNVPDKRYDIGIKAMKNIIKEIPDSKLYLISSVNKDLAKLIKSLKLEENVFFTGYQNKIENYLQNASLHIFPSFFEAYPMVLGEAKIYGIPTILCGIDYIALAKGGTVIVYDDNPYTVAKEAIKILKDENYRKKLGAEARESIQKLNDNLLAKRWVKFLVSVYEEDDETYQELGKSGITEEKAEEILKNQLKLLQRRIPRFQKKTLLQLKHYEFI